MRLIGAFLVACALALWPSVATAAGELGLSSDQVHWSPHLATPLFPPDFRWVPGDTETASFWVRNQSPDAAVLDVVVLGASVDELMETGDLTVTIAAENGSSLSTTQVGRQQLISSRPVASGQTERIDVTVALAASSTNQSQVRAFDLGFEVRLTQASASGHSDSDDSDDSDESDDADNDRNGILPGAGGPVWWLLPSGLLGVGAGWLMTASARRKEEADV